jgi:hypothetical protein
MSMARGPARGGLAAVGLLGGMGKGAKGRRRPRVALRWAEVAQHGRATVGGGLGWHHDSQRWRRRGGRMVASTQDGGKVVASV